MTATVSSVRTGVFHEAEMRKSGLIEQHAGSASPRLQNQRLPS